VPKVVFMAETNTANVEHVSPSDSSAVGPVSLGLIRVSTIVIVALAVIEKWTKFGVTSKFLAIVFLSFLIFDPVLTRLGEKRSGKPVDRSVLTLTCYIWAMLTTVIFWLS
jgi:hypothetical protein